MGPDVWKSTRNNTTFAKGKNLFITIVWCLVAGLLCNLNLVEVIVKKICFFLAGFVSTWENVHLLRVVSEFHPCFFHI